MIKTEQAHLSIEAASHPGLTGKQNEDRFGVTAFLTGKKQQTQSLLAVLCDGIGGHRAGEIAAEMGVSIITEHITASDAQQPLKTMGAAITRASEAVYQASQEDMGRAGMGATCTCAWVIGNQLYTANLGDSRIYLLREGHLLQLTTDHTWIQEALDAGIITDEEGGNHPNAHVIRRYLGSKTTPETDFRLWFFEGEDDDAALANQGLRLQPEDVIMLCSDGLTDLVADEEIHTVLQKNSLADAPEILIGMANERGGHDNTTVVLLQMPPKAAGILGGKKKRRWVIGCLVVLMIASALVSAILLGLRWWGGRLQATETAPGVTETLSAEATADIWTGTPSQTATPLVTAESPAEMTTPRPSITPWPTHTRSP